MFMKPGVPPRLSPTSGPALPPQENPMAVAAMFAETVTDSRMFPACWMLTTVSDVCVQVTANRKSPIALDAPRNGTDPMDVVVPAPVALSYTVTEAVLDPAPALLLIVMVHIGPL